MFHANATGQNIRQTLRREGLSAPLTVTWEVTRRCNLNCLHCLSDSGPQVPTLGELSLAEAKGVVEQLARARVFQLHFGGGEPFVFPGFMDLLRHARRQGLCCLCISSNGALLDGERIAALEALGGVYVQVSVDGATEASCDAVRGGGAFRRAVAALERLRGSGIVRTMNLVLTRRNAGELDGALALARRHGATLRVTRLKPSGRGAGVYEALRPTQAQLAGLHGWLGAHPEVLTGDTFFHLNAFGDAPLPGFRFCGAARLTCLIAPNGDVFPCAFTQSPEFRAGNLRERTFQEIWDGGESFNTVFREGSAGEGSAPDGTPDSTVGSAQPCATCPEFEGCGGGCPAVKHALTGRLDIPDPDCVLETAAAMGPPTPLCHG